MHKAAVIAISLLSGCAGWNYLELPADTVLAPRQQLQVWSGSKAHVLHGVRVTQDSLFGVPLQKPMSCDSCRVGMPRASVDSVRTGNLETSSLVLAAVPFILLLLAFRGVGD